MGLSRWFGLLGLGVLLLGSFAFALTLEVNLKESVTLSGETVTLGDVAEISYPNPRWEDVLRKLSLGVLPPPGGERIISPREIYNRVVERRIPGLDYIYFSGAPSVRVQVEGVLLAREVVEEKIRSALRERFPWAEEIDVTLSGKDRIVFPSPEFGIVLPAILKPWGTQSATLVDESGTRDVEVRFTPLVRRSVVRAARNLARGETLGEEDVTVQLEVLSPENEKALKDVADVLGKPLRRAVRAGEIVTPDALGKEVLVKRGDLVTLVAEYGGIVVTTTGKARGEGSLGDTIIVENLSSRKRVEGVIVDERTVQVVVR